jgi:hypothetical protein
MKNLLYILTILVMTLFASCTDDSGSNPEFTSDEIPYIYCNWVQNMTGTVGTEISIKMMISPADGSVTYKWTLDGNTISTDLSLAYTPTEAGTHKLIFEASRNGIINTRTCNLTITNAK